MAYAINSITVAIAFLLPLHAVGTWVGKLVIISSSGFDVTCEKALQVDKV